ncbi:MAG TPA: M1 family aminopeptidase, partial [Flavobacteriales bacterium]|nr:M1 family aminopeptidase [Flavobacteriales bacterium]
KHKKMVNQAYKLEQGWWALDSEPQDRNYGEHSYNKGAEVIHTLRSYLGESVFRTVLTSFLSAHEYQSVNSAMMRDHLSQSTGVDLTDFFNDWIFQPGWSAFEVDDLQATPSGNAWNVHIDFSQKMRGPASFYHHVPVTLVLMGTDHHQQHRVRIDLGGANTSVDVSCPFQPAYHWLNDDDRISLAITGSTDTITNGSGVHSFALANFDVVMPAITDTMVTRVEQYWVAPDNGPVEESFAYIISPDRYWRVAGDVPAGCAGRVIYDGRNTTTGNLDPLLLGDTLGFNFIEDSLVMLYRALPTEAWREWSSSINTLGSHSDGYGRINVDSLRAGEYTLAWRKSAVGIAERSVGRGWTISPNPSSGEVTITASAAIGSGMIQVIDSAGRVVRSAAMKSNRIQLDLHRLSAGTYHLQFQPDHAPGERIGPLLIE